MKKLTILLTFIAISLSAHCQNITGQWNGLLKAQGTQLRLVIHIERFMVGYTLTMDSPDQNAKGIPVDQTNYKDSVLSFEIKSIGAKYNGTLQKNNIFSGTFTQMGQSFPLDFSREEIVKEKRIRPQEPLMPYPYYTENVTFDNTSADIKLAGTLTLPHKNGTFPVVILITGSGPQNRNEEVFEHKPFLVLADHLTRNGIAVLRYDDRGTAKSTGDFFSATTMDFATDVEAAIKYLQSRKEIDETKIGLIGHSEGGIIAPLVASKLKTVDFIVLMAGTGIRGDKLLLMQSKLLSKAYGVSDEYIDISQKISKEAYKLVVDCKNSIALKTDLENYLKQALKDNPEYKMPHEMTDEAFIEAQLKTIVSPWMIQFIKHDPAPILEKVSCPVLAINGSKDLQVPATTNIEAIKSALSKGENNKVTTEILQGLNHMFQECKTGAINEYGSIEQTFSPVALKTVSDWILEEVK